MLQAPVLPFAANSLEPHISATTLDYHFNKHHMGYFSTLQNAIVGTPFADDSIDDIILKTRNEESHMVLFNNAAQVWNHSFYWQSLKPHVPFPTQGLLSDMVARDFDSLDNLKAQLKQAALTQFGSGWAWLVYDRQGLSIIKTPNAHTPFGTNTIPLLTIDVWEHAYYLDYKNMRASYVDTVLGHLINWEFVAKNLSDVAKS